MNEPDPAFYDLWETEHANRIYSDFIGGALRKMSRERTLPGRPLGPGPDRGTARTLQVSSLQRNRATESEGNRTK